MLAGNWKVKFTVPGVFIEMICAFIEMARVFTEITCVFTEMTCVFTGYLKETDIYFVSVFYSLTRLSIV